MSDEELSDEEYWPDRIIAQKTITYDVQICKEQIKEDNPDKEEITMDDVIEHIQNLILDDFSCGWGHEADLRDILIYDPDGDEY